MMLIAQSNKVHPHLRITKSKKYLSVLVILIILNYNLNSVDNSLLFDTRCKTRSRFFPMEKLVKFDKLLAKQENSDCSSDNSSDDENEEEMSAERYELYTLFILIWKSKTTRISKNIVQLTINNISLQFKRRQSQTKIHP